MEIIDVSYSWNGSLSSGNNPVAIIEHHAEAKSCTVEDIHRWHLDRGWCGIGYHFFIKKDGRIFRGRPEWAIGAHCPGFNSNSFGVCHEGNFMTEQMTAEQKAASIWLNKYLMAKYPKIQNLYQHGKVYPTACAGTNFAEVEIFSATLSADVAPTPPIVETVNRDWLQVGDTGSKVSDLQSKLQKLGYTITVDGDYGKGTKAVVYKFQQDYKLSADGLAGKETLGKIDSLLSSQNAQTPAPNTNSMAEIVTLQKALNAFKVASLEVDGIQGPKTIEATKKFQGIVGATIDGIAGSETFTAIRAIQEKPLCGIAYVNPIPTRFIQWRTGASIDGIFGRGTASCVATWQAMNGLFADGVVGKGTWGVLIG